jgi:hypothetical protein
LADFACGVAKSMPVSWRKRVATLNIIWSTITGPPAYHIRWWWCARLTFACAACVEDVKYFGCSQHAIEGFDLVDATIEGSRSPIAEYPNRGWNRVI